MQFTVAIAVSATGLFFCANKAFHTFFASRLGNIDVGGACHPSVNKAVSEQRSNAQAGDIHSLWRFLCVTDQDEVKSFGSNEIISQKDSDKNSIIFVSGNWYDQSKVAAVLALARELPRATVLLTGGIGRLTDASSKAAGGEALLMRARLVAAGLAQDRISVFTGGLVTTHNLQALLLFMKQRHEGAMVASARVFVVEESYLMRRVLATLLALLLKDDVALSHIQSLTPVPTETSWDGLIRKHGDHEGIAAFFVLGELQRLLQYSSPKASVYLFPQDAAFGGTLPPGTPCSGLMSVLGDLQRSSLEVSIVENAIKTLESEYRTAIDQFKRVINLGPDNVMQQLAPKTSR
ncbi:hypothetical protein CYMTET_37823 [Cymbomonas tetramitiformis]|uniref:DUF218 domain-containing protein n=1 Tax=Cymbomonas tetramitiformis TaxID=36881 RepID=A0AAE0CD49_9CHLO|nr:hypothetical protein CYMTET_37823 [Cymbomonas tetramitiformis]